MRLDTVFPASHDLKHAMLMFSLCYGCQRLFPASGLRLDCDDCGARLCSECDKRKRKCACQEIKKFLENCDSFSEGARLMTGVTDNAPCDKQGCTTVDGCEWFAASEVIQ
jgi:hypothetical protein